MKMNHTYKMSIAPPPETDLNDLTYFEEGVLRTPSSEKRKVSLYG